MTFNELIHDNHVVKKKFATVSAVMSGINTASGHLEKRSIRVKQYLNPRKGKSGTIIFKWTWSKRASEIGSLSGINGLCRVTFDFSQCRHALARYMFVHARPDKFLCDLSSNSSSARM